VLFGLYFFGIILAGLTAILLKRFYFKQEDIPFVMELPPYRIPTIKNTARHMLSKTGQYLNKIGSVILIASIVIWGLGYYPKSSHPISSKLHAPALRNPEDLLKTNIQSSAFDPNPVDNDSYLERLGKTIEPAIRLLGFDWKIGVSILAGIAGKEIVVSTMGVIYQKNDEVGSKMSLGEKLRNETYTNGRLVYTPLVALSFLVFILIYLLFRLLKNPAQLCRRCF
jgi:ferrous iron transport protein B